MPNLTLGAAKEQYNKCVDFFCQAHVGSCEIKNKSAIQYKKRASEEDSALKTERGAEMPQARTRLQLNVTLIGMALAVVSMVALAPVKSACASGTLRIGMTAADIPTSFGQPDNGFEGYRFMGLMVYDALINFDLSSADKPSGLIPGLAESWNVEPSDKTKWIFKLRKGAKFHDGSEFNADAVIFNMDKLFKKDAPQYDPRQVSLVNFRIPAFKSVRKIDKYTVEFTTHSPDAFFPYQICYIMMASPAQWEATGKDWKKFAFKPSGTGPWKLTTLVPRERAEFAPNKDYWDKRRVPKLDKVVIFPIPDPNTRTAALLSGQVDWIEAPSPDTIPQLKSRGMKIVSNVYPHIWSYHSAGCRTRPGTIFASARRRIMPSIARG